MTIKVIVGIAIIAASFVYILKRPDKSMMDSLMEKRNAQMQEALAQTETAGEEPAAAVSPAESEFPEFPESAGSEIGAEAGSETDPKS